MPNSANPAQPTDIDHISCVNRKWSDAFPVPFSSMIRYAAIPVFFSHDFSCVNCCLFADYGRQ
jgi:hypothetical protein